MTAPEDLYLVTGGAGFVGSNLVAELVRRDARVRVLDDFSTGRMSNLEPWMDRIELMEGSVVDRDDSGAACAGVDYVLHQAALPSVPRSIAHPRATHAANATGTLTLLEAAREAGVRRLVYASSSSTYGDTPGLPKVETMPTRPGSPYAVAKLAGEHYCRAYWKVHGLETVSLRYFNVFGPRQDPSSQYSAVIPLFVTAALAGQPPTIHGDGGQTRDFTFVQNVVEANLKACEAGAENAVGEVFNVACGRGVSVRTLWETIRSIVGTDVDARHGPPRPGDVRDSLASLEKVREALGYEPTVELEKGLRRTVEWLQTSPDG